MWQNLKNYYHLAQAFFSALLFGFPSRKLVVIGVTGTDGKSTTANMIYDILVAAHKKVFLMTSLGAKAENVNLDTGGHVTTPSAFQVQKLFRLAKDRNCQYLIIEATSHGLDQNRLAFVNFHAGIITNVTKEHLDYHKSWHQYLLAKAKLFKNVKISILNHDDSSYKYLKRMTSGRLLTYGLSKKSNFNLENFPIKLQIFGDYNKQNALAAAACTSALGIDKKIILGALLNFSGIAGRMEKINIGQNFDVYIDFAHTPASLENALKSLKKISQKRKTNLIVVFGSAGQRDWQKRPKMGKITAQFADYTVLTAEDPRKESVENICAQIARGLTSKGKRSDRDFSVIKNRSQAIKFAIRKAQKGDVVALFGKGHEKSMVYDKEEIPWNERLEAIKAIKSIRGKSR